MNKQQEKEMFEKLKKEIAKEMILFAQSEIEAVIKEKSENQSDAMVKLVRNSLAQCFLKVAMNL